MFGFLQTGLYKSEDEDDPIEIESGNSSASGDSGSVAADSSSDVEQSFFHYSSADSSSDSQTSYESDHSF